MKSTSAIILGFSLVVLCSSNGFSQGSPVKRNTNFEVGDVLSSSTGTITGDLRKATVGDDEAIAVFTGSNSNLRSDVIRTSGVVSVKVSETVKISKGDLLAVAEDGKVGKLEKSGTSIGTAVSEPQNGMVKVRLNFEYVTVK
ncbi:MAG: hypothetical protein K9J17_08790 [Flavobacteriales bacterium]|nr:hypothetical protein [Flavobacteriales bacterium]